MDLGRSDWRSAGSGRVVQPHILSVGTCFVEFTVRRTAERDATRTTELELGSLARSGARAALPSGLPSGDLALLVGLWLRDDGGSGRAHTGCAELGVETGTAGERG